MKWVQRITGGGGGRKLFFQLLKKSNIIAKAAASVLPQQHFQCSQVLFHYLLEFSMLQNASLKEDRNEPMA